MRIRFGFGLDSGLYGNFVQQQPCAIYVIDADTQVVYMNRAYSNCNIQTIQLANMLCGPFTVLFVYHRYHQLRHQSLPGKTSNQHVISGFRCLCNEIFALQRCYAARIGGKLSTFRDHLPVQSSRVK